MLFQELGHCLSNQPDQRLHRSIVSHVRLDHILNHGDVGFGGKSYSW